MATARPTNTTRQRTCNRPRNDQVNSQQPDTSIITNSARSGVSTPTARHGGRGGSNSQAKKKGGSRRPGTNSLWLLPSGPDQVGDSAVRRLPAAHMVTNPLSRKRKRVYPSLSV